MSIIKVLPVLLFLFFLPQRVIAVQKDINVSASIGDSRFTITGYTSPGARVSIEGQGLYDETFADNLGRFAFLNRFSPFAPREACLTAVDTNGRITQPVCLPRFPVKKNVAIGPILLPPSLSVDQNSYSVDDYGVLSGKAAPNSTVELMLAKGSVVQSFDLTARTDAHGTYSMTLPTQKADSVYIFARNFHRSLQSDKSLTLTFTILPFWLFIVEKLKVIIAIIQHFFLPMLLLLECILLAYLLSLKRQRKTTALALPPAQELELTE